MNERISRMTGREFSLWRTTQGLTQLEAGALLDRTPKTIQSYEKGGLIPLPVALACQAIKDGWRDYSLRKTEQPPAGGEEEAPIYSGMLGAELISLARRTARQQPCFSSMSGADLKKWCLLLDITQDEAGEMLGRSRRSLQMYEKNGPLPLPVALACRAISSRWRDYGERSTHEPQLARQVGCDPAAAGGKAETSGHLSTRTDSGSRPEAPADAGRDLSVIRTLDGLEISIRSGNPVAVDHVLGGEARTLWLGGLPVAAVFRTTFELEDGSTGYAQAWGYCDAGSLKPYGPFSDLADVLDHAISRIMRPSVPHS
jgi:DNA-binding XRE family transcriptional regulator